MSSASPTSSRLMTPPTSRSQRVRRPVAHYGKMVDSDEIEHSEDEDQYAVEEDDDESYGKGGNEVQEEVSDEEMVIPGEEDGGEEEEEEEDEEKQPRKRAKMTAKAKEEKPKSITPKTKSSESSSKGGKGSTQPSKAKKVVPKKIELAPKKPVVVGEKKGGKKYQLKKADEKPENIVQQRDDEEGGQENEEHSAAEESSPPPRKPKATFSKTVPKPSSSNPTPISISKPKTKIYISGNKKTVVPSAASKKGHKTGGVVLPLVKKPVIPADGKPKTSNPKDTEASEDAKENVPKTSPKKKSPKKRSTSGVIDQGADMGEASPETKTSQGAEEEVEEGVEEQEVKKATRRPTSNTKTKVAVEILTKQSKTTSRSVRTKTEPAESYVQLGEKEDDGESDDVPIGRSPSQEDDQIPSSQSEREESPNASQVNSEAGGQNVKEENVADIEPEGEDRAPPVKSSQNTRSTASHDSSQGSETSAGKRKRSSASDSSQAKNKPAPAEKITAAGRLAILEALSTPGYTKLLDFKANKSDNHKNLARHWREVLSRDLRLFWEGKSVNKTSTSKAKVDGVTRKRIWQAVCDHYEKADWNRVLSTYRVIEREEADSMTTTKLKRHFRDVMRKEGEKVCLK